MFTKKQSNHEHLYYIITITLIITVTTTIFLMNPLIVNAQSSADYSDIPNNAWYEDYVQILTTDERQIIQGYPDGTFKPNTKLTRDQFITMVVRAAGFNPGNASGYWAQNYIDKAIDLGYIEADDFSSYTGQITREEMSMIIVRAVDYLEGEQTFTKLTEVLQVVNDSEDFTYKYNNYIMKTYKLGIITGYTDHTFKPQGVLTRSEATAVVVRLIDPEERIEFDFESLYNAMYTGLESHLLGGANWVDPVAASDKENAEEDWGLITSDMGYSPTKSMIELDIFSELSTDHVDGAFMYDENGPYAGHLDDFERLLQRRMPQNQVDIVMNYLEKKKDYHTYLEHDQAFFYLDNDRYLVRIDEVKLYDTYDHVKGAVEVNFNIWYRDANFINEHEEDITQIMPYTDVVIYR